MKKQIILIHGGDTFATYNDYISALRSWPEFEPFPEKHKKWKDSLTEELGDDFEVLAPAMPSKHNAKYVEWKIWFEKVIPLIKEEVILIGHSLGGIFLAKYLSEENFSKKIVATFLISAPYDEDDSDESLADFGLPESLTQLEKQSSKIFVYHSKDDPIVPFIDASKYMKVLPSAMFVEFADRGHFLQGEFPELVAEIKQL